MKNTPAIFRTFFIALVLIVSGSRATAQVLFMDLPVKELDTINGQMHKKFIRVSNFEVLTSATYSEIVSTLEAGGLLRSPSNNNRVKYYLPDEAENSIADTVTIMFSTSSDDAIADRQIIAITLDTYDKKLVQKINYQISGGEYQILSDKTEGNLAMTTFIKAQESGRMTIVRAMNLKSGRVSYFFTRAV